MSRLAELSLNFGGADVVRRLVSPTDLATIVSFVGPSIVASIGVFTEGGTSEEDINLTEFGYVPDTTYSVLDANFSLLYQGQTEDYLGKSISDRNFGKTIEHGSYYYVTFENADREAVTLLLWLYRELSPEGRLRTIEGLRVKASANRAFGYRFAVNISARIESKTEKPLWLLLRKGNWQESPTLSELYADPQTKIISFSTRRAQLLADITDSWVAVIELMPNPIIGGRPQIASVWKLIESFGTGRERLLPKNEVCFIAGAGFNRLSPGTNALNYQASRLTLNAQFGFGYDLTIQVKSASLGPAVTGKLSGFAGSGEAIMQAAAPNSYFFGTGFSFIWASTNFFARADLRQDEVLTNDPLEPAVLLLPEGTTVIMNTEVEEQLFT